jgi:ATP-binding cassette subfamily B protein
VKSATESEQPLSPELAAALGEKPSRPGREIFGLMKSDGILTPFITIGALALAAGSLIIEALLMQGLFDLSVKLSPPEQRLGAMIAILIFGIALLLLDLPIISGLLRIGRRFESRLRLAFLKKIPRLGDRYFQSRLISDMADRNHNVHSLRVLPLLGGRLVRLSFELVLTTLGIIWLDPVGAPVVVPAALIALALPIAMQSRLTERDLRIRSHNGALSRFYLDALMGLTAIRTHGAEKAIRGAHESLLVEWARASIGLLRVATAVAGVQALTGFVLAARLLWSHLSRSADHGGTLLLVYWALNLPNLGQEIALIVQQYPAQRNVTLRLLEPLGAPEETQLSQKSTKIENQISAFSSEIVERTERQNDEVPAKVSIFAESIKVRAATVNSNEVIRGIIPAIVDTDSHRANPKRGAHIVFEEVSIRAAGHLILDNVDLTIEGGSHIGIVGPSGAGKSSFVGLLLGWHRAAGGQVLIDGEPLDADCLDRLRQKTAWVDPSVQIWNRSLIANLRYGADSSGLAIGPIIENAELRCVLEKLPDGLQTILGEGGGLVSCGEGQRVRLGRAMLRPNVRLVILDEPFRGLDRDKRRVLLARARRLWNDATLLCITHDISETAGFDRVLVVDQGRIVEDDHPAKLAEQSDSRYRALLDAEDAVREELWSDDQWRRLRLEHGKLIEDMIGGLK